MGAKNKMDFVARKPKCPTSSTVGNNYGYKGETFN